MTPIKWFYVCKGAGCGTIGDLPGVWVRGFVALVKRVYREIVKWPAR